MTSQIMFGKEEKAALFWLKKKAWWDHFEQGSPKNWIKLQSSKIISSCLGDKMISQNGAAFFSCEGWM